MQQKERDLLGCAEGDVDHAVAGARRRGVRPALPSAALVRRPAPGPGGMSQMSVVGLARPCRFRLLRASAPRPAAAPITPWPPGT